MTRASSRLRSCMMLEFDMRRPPAYTATGHTVKVPDRPRLLLSISQPATTRPARRQLGIAAQRQRLVLSPRLGRHTPETVQLIPLAFRTLHRFTVKDKRFEGVLTVSASVLVQRHRYCSSRDPQGRRFLYTSLARKRICRALSVRLPCPKRATLARTASSLASSWSSSSASNGAATGAGRRGSSR